jgi:uncharacterized membrane protein YgdD (TMEM256/DUF423 family)
MSTLAKKTGILMGILIIALAAALPAFAHHSFAAEFDTNKAVKITGKVTSMKWANPHAWIYIDVVGRDGKTTNWALEMSAANSLIRRGWRKEDLPVGTVLLVEGWQARNGSPTANITSVTFTDGRRLFAGSSNPAAKEQ